MNTTNFSSIRIANAPCSWGVLEFDLPGKALGYAQVLDELKETGYAGTELGDWGFMPAEPAKLRAELEARKLSLLGAFVPIAFAQAGTHAEGEERALKTARLIAEAAGKVPFIVLADDNGKDPARTNLAGRIRPEHSLSKKQWDTFSEGVNRIAGAVRQQTGLRSVFHHHCAGFVTTRATTGSAAAGIRSRRSNNTETAFGMFISRIAARKFTSNPAETNGTISNHSSTASSASWAKGTLISRRLWRS
jgi:sugar phosphate isomerase/epimerase